MCRKHISLLNSLALFCLCTLLLILLLCCCLAPWLAVWGGVCISFLCLLFCETYQWGAPVMSPLLIVSLPFLLFPLFKHFPLCLFLHPLCPFPHLLLSLLSSLFSPSVTSSCSSSFSPFLILVYLNVSRLRTAPALQGRQSWQASKSWMTSARK